MRVAMLSPIAWRTPPRHYGPWESVVSSLTEGLIASGIDVTLFATEDSKTKGRLHAVCKKGYEEDKLVNTKVWECLHISELFERAEEFSLIHNHFDFLPLTYSNLVTTPLISTIHGFSSSDILPVYKKYNGKVFYVAISNADRVRELDYTATIHHGIELDQFEFQSSPEDYLLFFGRIHHDKGAKEAIEIAGACGKRLVMAGIIQDQEYYRQYVFPFIDNYKVIYMGSADPMKRNKLLRNASALLHPINFNEPFGLSVVEAMACGTPVIAYNRGSMPEIIEHGKNGFLVQDKDEAIKVVGKIKSIERKQCRKSVEECFTVDHMVEKYIQTYKEILDKKKKENHRPWGYYQVLSDEKTYKTKKIVLSSGCRLSLQRHQKRAEHWYIVKGEAKITLDEKQLLLCSGQAVDIPRRSVHRIENKGTDELVFIEVQTGDYFGEDDIERIEDDFGRK